MRGNLVDIKSSAHSRTTVFVETTESDPPGYLDFSTKSVALVEHCPSSDEFHAINLPGDKPLEGAASKIKVGLDEEDDGTYE